MSRSVIATYITSHFFFLSGLCGQSIPQFFYFAPQFFYMSLLMTENGSVLKSYAITKYKPGVLACAVARPPFFLEFCFSKFFPYKYAF